MISKLLFFIGIACLHLYGFFVVEAHMQQAKLASELYQPLLVKAVKTDSPAPPPARRRRLNEGDLFGRLEIPRLNLSVMVMEGDGAGVLRLGAGHVPGTQMCIAGHRDTFFRALKDIHVNDTI